MESTNKILKDAEKIRKIRDKMRNDSFRYWGNKQSYLCAHPDGTYTIGKGKWMVTNFSRKQLESLKAEIEAELYQDHADQWEKEQYA